MKEKRLICRPGKKVSWLNNLKIFKPLLVLGLLILLFLLREKINFKRANFFIDNGGKLDIILVFNRLLVFDKKKVIWQSNPDWQVEDFLVADLNRDGQAELNLAVFKSGFYGDRKPFWIEEDAEFSCHFFVLGVTAKEVFPIWQSSQIEKPICQFTAEDQNNDGFKELVVEEGIYTKNSFSCRETIMSAWQWNGWGFTKI
jgi:hypothetical protein